jgi:hypothetical protein
VRRRLPALFIVNVNRLQAAREIPHAALHVLT